MDKIKVLRDTTVIYSNPQRPYWRKAITHKAGDVLDVELNMEGDRKGMEEALRSADTVGVAPRPATDDLRWWRTANTYWYALYVGSDWYEVQGK